MPSSAAPLPACALSPDLLKLLMCHTGALGLTSPQTLPRATPTPGRRCGSGAGAVFAQLVHSGLYLVSILRKRFIIALIKLVTKLIQRDNKDSEAY